LDARQTADIESGVEPVVEAEQEQRHPAQQVQVGVGRHGGVIASHRHGDAHPHPEQREQNRSPEAND